MSVPISEFIDVSISIAPTPQGLSGFGQLLFVSKTASSATVPITKEERVRYYSSMQAVAVDFPLATNEVNKCATAYYAQTPRPRDFLVGLVSATATPAYMYGTDLVDSLTSLKLVTAGGMTFKLDATDVVLKAINLSAITSFADAAAILQTAIQVARPGATCVFTKDQFLITSGTTGANSLIGAASAEVQSLATRISLMDNQSAVTVQGAVAETPTYALTQCEQVNNSFYGVVIPDEYADTAEVLNVADWVEARPKVFFNTSNDATILTSANSTTFVAQLKGKSLKKTLSIYSPIDSDYAGASVAGRAFTVNFEGTNTTITLMYKKLPTIAVASLNSTQRANMDRINCNAFIDVGGNSFFAESKMADGGYFDTVHGLAWLQNRIETDVFNLLYTSPTKVPYDDTGVSMIIAKVDEGLRQGVRNGLIAPGNTTDGTYLEMGYVITYVPVRDVSAADKGNRIYRGISFQAVGAGAIHKVVITGSFSE